MQTRRSYVLSVFVFGLALCLVMPQASAAPVIFVRGVVNSASFTPAMLPGGAIARGSLFTIFGRDLGPATAAQAPVFPLETALGGVSIEVEQNGTIVQAIPLFVYSTQANAVMPSNAPLGDVVIRVIYNGERSNGMPIRIVDNNIGIYTATGAGLGPGIVQNYIAPTNQPINSPTITAAPGQTVTLWATGLGPITQPDTDPPPIGNLPVNVTILVGGVPATNIPYSGRAPCCAGVDQVVFEIPANAPEGCYVPIRIIVNGAVSNTVTVAISSEGGACTEPGYPWVEPLIAGQNVGALTLLRVMYDLDQNVIRPSNITADQTAAIFVKGRGGNFPYSPLWSLPPAGTCATMTSSGNVLHRVSGRVSGVSPIAAGTFTVTGAGGTKPLGGNVFGALSIIGKAFAGGPVGLPGVPDADLFWSPGSYQATGSAGATVGAVSTSIDVADPITWTNRDSIDSIDRSQGTTLTWSAPGDGRVFVAGVNVDIPSNSSALFLCAAPPGASSLEVTPELLNNFLPSRNYLGGSISYLMFAGYPTGLENMFTAQGLAYGGTFFRSMEVKSVRIQ